MRTKLLSFLTFLVALPLTASAGNVIWYNGHGAVTYTTQKNYAPVVGIALQLFETDMKAVTGHKAESRSNGHIEIYQLDMLDNKEFSRLEQHHLPLNSFITKKDAFYICTDKGKIIVAGSNARGTAYGILELSRLAGVSPWIWWGDVKPERKRELAIDENFRSLQIPSVEYRGIFINDEDWSTRVWAHKTMEPNLPQGTIGPRTYAQIFSLLLRLKANTVWPAMHEGTKAFFAVKGNKEIADKFDIYVGTSHCEPLLRNNVAEWDHQTRGAYNYLTNREAVENYWTERVIETSDMDALYTIGMRGIHDGPMEGVKTLDEQTTWLQKVIDSQRKILSKHINKDIRQIPQVFIPYKEVLQVYENGLRVPDDVMLMWCDDNYGYLTRLPDEEQQKRSGGGGVYYHLSYWGRPHDYLWLTTTQPGLIYNEMRTAYDHNARRLWIANVHDPKVAAYDLSLFLDMAWNIDCVNASTLQDHLRGWLTQQFGETAGKRLLPVMTRFYHLTGIRKPEFMGWSQVELDKKKYERGLSPAGDTEFNPDAFGNELERYLNDYLQLGQQVEEIRQSVRPELHDAYFAAIEYPVRGAGYMATKQLQAQEARHIARPSSFHHDEEALEPAVKSLKAYRALKTLTEQYNEMAKGKWKGLMDYQPRGLPVFAVPNLPGVLSDEEIRKYGNEQPVQAPLNTKGVIVRNACDYTFASRGATPVEMLGHSMKAVALPKGGSLTYSFRSTQDGQAMLNVAVIPTQANDKGDIRFSVSIDGAEPTVYTIKEPFRSEQWKRNVLRGQAVRQLPVRMTSGSHKLVIQALDDHIIVDQWMIDFAPDRPFYVFPVKPAL